MGRDASARIMYGVQLPKYPIREIEKSDHSDDPEEWAEAKIRGALSTPVGEEPPIAYVAYAWEGCDEEDTVAMLVGTASRKTYSEGVNTSSGQGARLARLPIMRPYTTRDRRYRAHEVAPEYIEEITCDVWWVDLWVSWPGWPWVDEDDERLWWFDYSDDWALCGLDEHWWHPWAETI